MTSPLETSAEEQRLEESVQRKVHWKRWGPYLSERQWGTVREDYSAEGTPWEYFPHEHARSRAYRWGEDGLGGISDRHQVICFAVALWNGRDPILKERLFGVTGNQGNHGEDVKEYYYYLDSTPTHSYMKYLYKYPQAEYPYQRLIEENRRRGREQPEFELIDSGIFESNRYFDVFVEYAKAGAEDILIRITACNRGPDAAELTLLPTVWLRNEWSWGGDTLERPKLDTRISDKGETTVQIQHSLYGMRWLVCENSPELLFTENETNFTKLFGTENRTAYVKDGINEFIVHGNQGAVNPALTGTKAAAKYVLQLAPGASGQVRLRLTDQTPVTPQFGDNFDAVFAQRSSEADAFFKKRHGAAKSDDARAVQRQALSGLLWSKQFYHYDVSTWLKGDPAQPPPPAKRLTGRNHQWRHLYNADVLSMPDKWEFPWYASWDLAFHCVAVATVDPTLAKEQLILMLREWYMHPNGQIPAYEWAFDDVNPPVHAWAALRVYQIEQRVRGQADRAFLEKVFHKLLLNFTWWVNRKDVEGMNVFEGGFLGLDNIGVFDRSAPLPTGGYIEQSDGTSWMGMYSLNMLAIAMELARANPAYEDVASKFYEHFIHIATALNEIGGEGAGVSLWDEADGFYYDVLHMPSGVRQPLRVRSMVGLIPLFAVQALEPQVLAKLPGFKRRMQWFVENRPAVANHMVTGKSSPHGPRLLLSLVNRQRLLRMARYLLDETEFLSPYGIRSLSKYHYEHPYILQVDGQSHSVAYEPAESTTGLFGGNSNWRGPVWFPVNFLLIESLQKFHHFFGDELKVECPVGSGKMLNLWEVSAELSRRMVRLFLRDAKGRRPVFGGVDKFQGDEHWRDLIPFYEYFHGDNGAGLGASHQTGWTALVAKLIEQSGE